MSKTVVITGCSSGIGFATAQQFALKGYKVIAGARRLEAMKPLEAYGVKIVELDVTSEESIQKLKKLIEGEYDSKVLYLFNNAGQPYIVPCIDASYDGIKQLFDVNVFGAMRLTAELAPFVIETKGTIGFTGSVAGLFPFPFLGMYSSSKAALHAYTSTLAIELEPFNVKVLNFIAGGVDTGINDDRPLKLTSLYNEDGMEAVLDSRSHFGEGSMSPETYAKKVVSDFENSKLGKLNIYRGSKASLLHTIASFPRWMILFLLRRGFGVLPLWATLKKKYA